MTRPAVPSVGRDVSRPDRTVSIALFAGMVGWAFVQPVQAAEAAKFKETVVWSFGSGTDGQNPSASLIDVKGMFYSTTGGGGIYGGGTVFALEPGTGTETVLYSFCSQDNCTDGEYPPASLIDVKGMLYGTTESGGENSACGAPGCGTVFSLDPTTDAEKVIYSFCDQNNCNDGALPLSNLIDVKGMLYGTTTQGGTSEDGTAFTLDPKTGAERVLHAFGGGTDGSDPASALIAVNGTLYGTTVGGGGTGCDEGGCGTAFSLDPRTGAEKVLYSFCSQQNCTGGEEPAASLIDVKGTLYGTTFAGGGTGCGGSGCGTVFSLDTNTGAETVLYSFCSQQNCADGEEPVAGLIDVKGTLYGTTYNGGADYTGCYGYGCGTVFSLKRNR